MKLIKILLICILSALLIIIASLFWPRFIFQKGITQLKLKNYTPAAAFFKKAEQAMPDSISTWFARADLFRIYTNYGQTLYHIGIKDWKEQGLTMTSFNTLTLSKSYLFKAAKIEPSDYINAYWLTRSEQSLEKTFAWFFPKKPNPYNAFPYYQKALALRPSGITVRYAYLQYVQFKGHNSKIPALVQNMTQIYPPSYWRLKKESFFRDLTPNIEQGLNTALEKQILPQDALKALSNIYSLKNNFERAIAYYKDLLILNKSKISPSDYTHMGALHLKNKQYEDSLVYFEKSFFLSKNPSSTINRIYRIFKNEKRFGNFLSFSRILQEKDTENPSLDMIVATCWIDMGFPELAKARLIKINAAKPNAPVYYRLAQLSAKEKNWDQMELFAQKATILDQTNHNYYTLLSQSLIKQKKHTHAEEVATKAIHYAPKNNPWVYNNRARIRWTLKKYTPAAQDWKKAFTLKPDRSDFPYRIALAHEQLGQFKQALTFARQALALAPDNKTYKALQKRLD
jgi:tetratricopeptide (TPR) repeat protein